MLERALTAAGPEAPAGARAKALAWSGHLAIYQGAYPEAKGRLEESRALWMGVGEARGIASALGSLAIVAKDGGDAEGAERLLRESLARWREAGEPVGVASTLGYLGILAADRGDRGTARRLYDESLQLRREVGDRWGIAASLNNLGPLAIEEGDLAAAQAALEESLALRRELGDRRCTAITLNHLGRVACARGEADRARQRFSESLRIAWEIGDRRSVAYSLEAFASLAVYTLAGPSGAGRAARLLGAAAALRDRIHAPRTPADSEAVAPAIQGAIEALGRDGFARAEQAGKDLPVEEAVGMALGEGE